MTRTHYQAELESVQQNVVEMAETTLALFDEAVCTVSGPNADHSERASELESKTNHQHRLIHDKCLNLITLQAPVARDARFVTGTLDAIVDLELIGDYSYEIARLASRMQRYPPAQVVAQISQVATKVRGVLSDAIDAWRGEDLEHGMSARPQALTIRPDCEALYEKLVQLTSVDMGEAAMYLDLMLIAQHLERILRHTVSVAEQATEAAPLYAAHGIQENVR